MFVFEIITPGTWLDYPDKAWSQEIKNQLSSLESQFFEANAALNLFIHSQLARESHTENDDWGDDWQRRYEIYRTVEQERGGLTSHEQLDEISFEAEIRFKREKWSNGRPPKYFEDKLPFIYARAFLYALDAFDKFLGVLAKEANVPEQVSVFHSQITESFPHRRSTRNTAQHLEDRARGLGAGRNPQPLDLKPITNSILSAPGGGVLALDCLNGSKYGSTMSNGHYGEIYVTPESMQNLQKILDGVLHSFKWRGPKRHAPYA